MNLFSNLLAQTSGVSEFQMPEIQWSLIAPFVILSLGAVVLITITSIAPVLKGKGFPALFTCLTAVAAFAATINSWEVIRDGSKYYLVDGALTHSAFTVVITSIICITVLLVAMLFDDYLDVSGFDGPEWYVLLMISAVGGILMASANELILLFVGLEILSIAVYVLAGLHMRRSTSQEASFKYFVLGALSSAIFLYGIALTYGATGSTYLTQISLAGRNSAGLDPTVDSSLILVAMALLLVGFGFKISAVPFHFWSPDVYEGSPSPVVAFMASGVKVAAFAAMVRVFSIGFGPYILDWRPLIAGLAVVSLIVGSFLALSQKNIKRMLAYSSISHVGFMLIAFHGFGNESNLSAKALLFYLGSYAFLTAGTFGVITLLSVNDSQLNDSEHSLDDYRCMASKKPVLAVMLAVLLFAQAGIPFTSGFWAKFRVIFAAVENGSYFLAAIAMLAAVVAAVLYLRIVVSVFMSSKPEDEAVLSEANQATLDSRRYQIFGYPFAGLLAVALCVIATIGLGVYPDFGNEVLDKAATNIEISQ